MILKFRFPTHDQLKKSTGQGYEQWSSSKNESIKPDDSVSLYQFLKSAINTQIKKHMTSKLSTTLIP